MNIKEFKEKQKTELESKLPSLLFVENVTDEVLDGIFSLIENYDEKIFYEVVYGLSLSEEPETEVFPDNFINKFIKDVNENDNIKKFEAIIDRGAYGDTSYTFCGMLQKGKKKLKNEMTLPEDAKEFTERIRLLGYCNSYSDYSFSDSIITISGIELMEFSAKPVMIMPQYNDYIEFGSRLSIMDKFFELFRLEDGTKFSQRGYNYYFKTFLKDSHEGIVKGFSILSDGTIKYPK